MERRMFLSVTTGLATVPGYDIEYTGPYGSSLQLGYGSYTHYNAFGFISVPVSSLSAGYGVSPTNGVSSLNLNLYGYSTGNYPVVPGTFGVYVIPTSAGDTRSAATYASTLETFPKGVQQSTNTDINILGSTTSPYDYTSIGVTAGDEVGTFNVDSTLSSTAYTSYTFSSIDPAAQTAIASDINSNEPIRLAIVPETAGVFARFEGSFSTATEPQVQLTVTPVPLVSFSATTYSGTEADTNPANTTPVTVTVNDLSTSTVPTIVDYSTSNGTLSSNYTPTSGKLTFAPGVTSQTFNVNFKDVNTTQPSGTVNVSLTTDPSDTSGAILQAGATTATVQINYLQSTEVALSTSSATVAENAGTESLTVTRTGSLSAASTVQYTTIDGTPYTSGSLQTEGNAQAGRDYTATSGTLSFAAGASAATITVPILNVATFTGTRTFSVSLLNASSGTAIGSTSSAVISITDTAPASTSVLTGNPTTTNGIETNGPYSGNLDTYLSLASTQAQQNGFVDFPELEFADTSAVFPATPVGNISSIRLSLYNTALTGEYAGAPGNIDLYIFTDDTVATSSLVYTAAGDTGPSVLGTQAGATYVGTAYFPANQVGYNDFTFDNIPAAVSTKISEDLAGGSASGTTLRFAIVPSAGSTATADFVGANGSAHIPILSLLAGQTANLYETFTLGASSDSPSKGAATETFTVNRTGTDITDTATLNYTTADGTGVAGTNYVANSGVLNFAAGQSSATVTVTLLNPTTQYGDKTFSLSISSPTVSGTNHFALLGAPSTETVDVVDTRTSDTSQNADYANTVTTAGAKNASSAGVTYFDSEYASAGANASFGVADYNNTNEGNFLNFSGLSTVGVINQITLSTVNSPDTYSHAGNFDVYLVSNTSAGITYQASSLAFSTAADPVEGLGSQLGTKYLLGTAVYSPSQSSAAFSTFQLTSASSTTAGILAFDLNNNLPFRIVTTPENDTGLSTSSVVATFAGNITAAAGTTLGNGPNGGIEDPVLSFNYTPAVSASLPSWVSAPNGGATYDSFSNTLEVTGAVTITADPQATTPGVNIVVGDASGSSASVTTALTSGKTIHLGSLTLINGATFALGTSKDFLLTGGLSIDSTSQLDVGNGYLDVSGSSLAYVDSLIAEGYANGSWTGSGITSSAAAADSTHLTALGAILNTANSTRLYGSGTALGLFEGSNPAGSDVLVKYTYYGDANLNGKVDGSDYSLIDNGFANSTTLSGWYNGDFNYDGVINGSDYTLIDNAFNRQGAVFTASIATPAAQIAKTSVGNTLGTMPTTFTPTNTSLFSNKKVGTSLIDQLLSELVSSN